MNRLPARSAREESSDPASKHQRQISSSSSPATLSERRSPFLCTLFLRYARRYVARHVRAVRLSRSGGRPGRGDEAVIVVLNHPGWWDPLICMVLSPLFGARAHYAPMEAAALRRYRFFERLGFFGIEPGSIGGAATFLRTSQALARQPGNTLWITAQGKFTDPRQRPAGLRSGVGHLAASLEQGVVVPLALEYPFWTERTPEALARFGEPVRIEENRALSARAWTARIERELEKTQDLLAAEACRQNAEDFETILAGRTGVGGIYDWWRRLRALVRGKRFRSEHGSGDAE